MLARPAQARLPALRPVGAVSVLIMKPSPHFLTMPGKNSASSELSGKTLFSTTTLTSPIWFFPIMATVSGRSTVLPSRLPRLRNMRTNFR